MSFTLNRRALDALANGPQGQRLLERVGTQVRDRARVNAAAIQPGTGHETAIVTEVGADTKGAFVDVGYLRHHPGFVLWFAEVGTRHQAPQPHLRPALRPLD